MTHINVTKSFLPPREEFDAYVDKIWASSHLTNQGPLLGELEGSLSSYLNVRNLHFVTNGTLALQVAIRALELEGSDIITTPFSYVATTSAILWEHSNPIYVDIDPKTLCIDPSRIEAAITPNTKAILAVHVFGNACDVDAIQAIANKHKLKVIYDAAHAFGVRYRGRSLLSYGDASICSFHATKLFQTIEGGCVIAGDDKVSRAVDLVKRFGHLGDEHFRLGTNAKATEFQAAMGLANLPYMDNIISQRKKVFECYEKLLGSEFERQKLLPELEYNYSYFPIIFSSEAKLLKAVERLIAADIFPRRYFYPSLNKLPYLKNTQQRCPVSEDISVRILCLPLYPDLAEEDVKKISEIVRGKV